MNRRTSNPGKLSPSRKSWLYEQEELAQIAAHLRASLGSGAGMERFVQIWMSGEESEFVRVNQCRVRQIGQVRDMGAELELFESADGGFRHATSSFSLSGELANDLELARAHLRRLESEVSEQPIDPLAVPSKEALQSHSRGRRGELLDAQQVSATLLSPAAGLDLVGYYAGGPMMRAMFSSSGACHSFEADRFFWDYSIYTPERRAVKLNLAGDRFSADDYLAQIEEARRQTEILRRPSKVLEPAEYRTFLTPAAFSHLVTMLSWGALSEFAIRKGTSPLKKIREGEVKLSPLFSASECFDKLGVPRFNRRGESAAAEIKLFEKGNFASSLISARTAAEYGLTSNGASEDESARALWVESGDLASKEAYRRLGTGLYLTELHYLNWSDQPASRVTGMTRFACFWVENGEPVAPIENLRFDDTIFRLFGERLEALTREGAVIPSTSTYGERSTQAMRVPGALLKGMRFTL